MLFMGFSEMSEIFFAISFGHIVCLSFIVFLFDCYFGGGGRSGRLIWEYLEMCQWSTQKIGSLEHMMLMITMMRIREPVKYYFFR